MKKILLTLAVAGIACGSFAQGKIQFLAAKAGNVISYSTDLSRLKPADAALAGTLPAANTVMANVYYALGASQSAGSLVPAFASGQLITGSAGLLPGTSMTLNTPAYPVAVPAGSVLTFQVKVWDQAYATYDAALAAGSYTGATALYNLTAGNFSPNQLDSATSGWSAGGAPIVLQVVPEPTTAAIAGLGLASMLIFRRKKA